MNEWTETDEKKLEELQQRKQTWEEQQRTKILTFIESEASGLAMLNLSEMRTVANALHHNLKAWKEFLRSRV